MSEQLSKEEIDAYLLALGDPTEDASSPPVLASSEKNLKSPNKDENFPPNTPSNTPILASGNGAKAYTAIKKANQTLSHACDSSSYVGKAVAEIGAFAGQFMRGVREAIKAVLKALGFNASASGITSQLKKIAQYIKDVTKFIKEITKYIAKFIAYINAIKQLISFILSLPQKLFAFFKDCLITLQKQLIASYQQALGSTDISMGDSSLMEGIKEVTSSIGEFQRAVVTVTATAQSAVSTMVTPGVTAVDSKTQAEATKEVFAAAGFADTKNNFGRA